MKPKQLMQMIPILLSKKFSSLCTDMDCTNLVSIFLKLDFFPQEAITVKLGIQELLNKEQISFKELFSDY